MDSQSRIVPILGHLSWLAANMDGPVNEGRAYDAALLTYNAAGILQWRFMIPLASQDSIKDHSKREQVTKAIDNLVVSSRRMVEQIRELGDGRDDYYRRVLKSDIERAVSEISAVLSVKPIPSRVRVLETSPDVRKLLEEAVSVYAGTHGDAIARGRSAATSTDLSSEAAITEALASLIFANVARNVIEDQVARGAFKSSSAGFFKTAVDFDAYIQDDVDPHAKRLQWLAELLVTDAAEEPAK
jgi:hypothetical protein